MRIVVDNIAQAEAAAVIAQLHSLGLAAYGIEDAPAGKGVEHDILSTVIAREQDATLNQARPWAEARKKYVGKGL